MTEHHIPSDEDLIPLVEDGVLEPPDEDESEDMESCVSWATWPQIIWWLVLRRGYAHGGAGR